MSIRDRLRPVFREALGLDPEIDVETQLRHGERRWSSIGHLALVAAIEDEFEVELEVDHILNMMNFDQAVTMLRDLGIDDD